MTLNVTTKTVQDVANSVRRQFGDESGIQITDSDIFRWVNDGQRDIIVKNKVIKGKATITAVALQETYTLPDQDIAEINSILWDGKPLKQLQYVEAEAYILEYATTSGESGVPLIWYEWGGTVTLWPIPTTGGALLTLLYTKNPVHVDSVGTMLSIPDKYFNTLVQYVLAQAYEMDEDYEASQLKNQQFTGSLDTMADESGLTYPVIVDVVEY